MFVIAELGSNWRTDEPSKDRERLLALPRELCGMDVYALKLQLFKADRLYSRKRAPRQYEQTKQFEFPLEWLPNLAGHLNGLKLWASVFDTETAEKAAPYLDGIKIASGDITNFPLIRSAAVVATEYDLTFAFSTGAAHYYEIEKAFAVAQENYAGNIIVFHCISAYPARETDQRLCNIDTIRDMLPDNAIIGYSDHTERNLPAQLALAKGCLHFEKHVKTKHTIKSSPDRGVSVTMNQLKSYIQCLDMAECILGCSEKRFCQAELNERYMARRGYDGLRPATE